MNDVERAWLAAIIDAEGAIMVCKNGNPKYERVQISIVNTCHPLIEECLRIIGFSLNITTEFRKDGRFKSNLPLYKIVISNKAQILEVLHQIEPYLIAKKTKSRQVRKLLNEKQTIHAIHIARDTNILTCKYS